MKKKKIPRRIDVETPDMPYPSHLRPSQAISHLTPSKLATQFLILAALFLVGFGGQEAAAMSVLPPTFEELVTESGEIVRAQVVEVEPYRTTSRDGTAIIKTRVTWHVLRKLKGGADEEESLTLDFLGGQIGEEALDVGGMPTFVRGEVDFLFVGKNTGAICPLLAAGHGRYRVVTDPATRRAYVARENRTPLGQLADVATPLRNDPSQNPSASSINPAKAFSPESFEALVLSTLAQVGGSDAN